MTFALGGRVWDRPSHAPRTRPRAALKVLLLADEADPRAKALAETLVTAGHALEFRGRGSEADHLAATGWFDIVVFDVSVVGTDVVPRLRRRGSQQTLVAWVTGPSSALVAELLEAGADEVLHGGMGERELVVRLERATRARARTTHRVELGPLCIDPAHGEVAWHGRDVALTQRERELLYVLAESAGRTVRREEIYRQVWGYTMARGDRSVDVNVKRLRAKLARLEPKGLAVRTQPGVGYRLELAESAVTAL